MCVFYSNATPIQAHCAGGSGERSPEPLAGGGIEIPRPFRGLDDRRCSDQLWMRFSREGKLMLTARSGVWAVDRRRRHCVSPLLALGESGTNFWIQADVMYRLGWLGRL